MKKLLFIPLIILLAGCVVLEYSTDEPLVEQEKEPEKVEIVEAKIIEESGVEYTLLNEISGLQFLDPNEKVFVNLANTQSNPLKEKEFVVQKGVAVAHRVEFDIATDDDISIFIVPSYESFEQFGTDDFTYYEECTGLSNECYIPFEAGMVIVNNDDSQAKISREIAIYEPLVD